MSDTEATPAPGLSCTICGKTANSRGEPFTEASLHGHTIRHGSGDGAAKGRPDKPKGRKPASGATADKARGAVTGATPVRAAFQDIADTVPPGKSVPNLEQTSKLFGKILLYLSVLIALALIKGDPMAEDDRAKDELVARLQLDGDQSRSIMHPVARLVQPTKVWHNYGRQVIEHSDMLDAAVAIYEWSSELARYKADRAKRDKARREPVETTLRRVPERPDVSPRDSAPYEPVVVSPQTGALHPDTRTMEERAGVLLTREDVRRMRGEGA
ncbi:MAG: hypothetical protein M0Z88_04035 [Actinomycetota bacterium]|nr:hypothetical protein [Actinomycetota bacterium]